MNDFLVYNGQLIKTDTPLVTAHNRGLRYGDGLFETMRLSNGKIWLSAYHFERLFEGMQMLGFEKPLNMTAESLSSEIFTLCEKNNLSEHARIRLMVFRGSGALSDPVNNIPHYVIQASSIPPPDEQLAEPGCRIGICPDVRKSCDKYAALKTNNFLPYVVAAAYAKNYHLHDAIIKNSADRVCESTVANLFIIKDNVIYTPPLTEGCIAGVMRRYLLTQPGYAGFQWSEKPLSEQELLTADEIFLTNSVHPVRAVKKFSDKEYTNRSTKHIYQLLVDDL